MSNSNLTPYFYALKCAMDELARDPRVVFLGQSVRAPGTSMSTTLVDVPMEKRIELPVFEETQMGMTLGMALTGLVPVSIYPRWNFLLLAMNQLVNHIDKVRMMSWGDYNPTLIIRVGIGAESPLYPGPQHIGDFTEQIEEMCPWVWVRRLESTDNILGAYRDALILGGTTILVEHSDRCQ